MKNCRQTTTELNTAESLWRSNIPQETVFDLWEVRSAFHRHYQRPIRFISGSTPDKRKLFIPLSWVEEKNAWCFFPGETWSNKTWLEQNRLFIGGMGKEELAEELGAAFHLRYIIDDGALPEDATVDETGYLFHPAAYRHDIQHWWSLFRRKTEKNIRREMAGFRNLKREISNDAGSSLDTMVEMSLKRFGVSSYFADPRFLAGFEEMLNELSDMGLLRVTSIYCDGTPVAIDFGSVYRGRYTLLAGGTDADFPGVAKFINLHHLEWACAGRLDEVDFLCGDFSWKRLFHLTPRQLYLFNLAGEAQGSRLNS